MNLLSWLGDKASRTYDQLNPVDNGRTWKQRDPTSQGSVAQQVANKARAVVAQVNPADNGRTYSTVMRQGADFTPNPVASVLHQVTHNGLTNVVGRDIVKPSYNFMASGGVLGQHFDPYKRFSQGVTHGLERSAVGTAQGLSGLYDLATPGVGTNRLSKGLNTTAQSIDRTAQQQHVNPVVYHGTQALGDLAQFALGSGEAKLAANAAIKAPKIGGVIKSFNVAPRIENAVTTVTTATQGLHDANIGGRIAANTIRNIARPGFQAGNAAFTAMQAGKQAGQGDQVTPLSTAENLAIGGIGFPAAGAVGREVAQPVIRGAENALQFTKDLGLRRPTNLSPEELNAANKVVAARSGMVNPMDITEQDANLFHNAQIKLGAQPGTPDGFMAVDQALGAHRTFDTQLQQRAIALQEAKQKAQQFAQDHQIGMSMKAIDENGNPVSGFTGRPIARDNSQIEPVANLLPDAEQRVFAENPMITKQMGRQGREIAPQESPIQRNIAQEPQQQPRTPQPSDSLANPLPEYNTKKVGNIDKAFRSTRSIIERQGESGKKLGNMLQGSRDVQERYLAEVQKKLPTVRKLRGKDFEDFVEATQGHIRPKNAKVAQAVSEWQSVHPTIRDRAVNAGLEVGDLGPNYYPHFIDFDAVFKDKNKYNAAINHLVKTGQAPDAEAAIKLLGYAKDISRNRQFGNLEASRTIDIPFYDKPPNSLVSYLNSSAKRISQTETFGKQDENALKLINKIGVEGGDTEAAKNAYDIAVGAKQYNPTASKVSGNIRKYVTTTRLGLGALTNVSQNVNTGIVTGHLRTLASGLKQLSPKTREFVGDTGVIADAVLNDLKTQAGYASFGKKVAGKVVDKITAPLFGTVEKLNRSIAATSGRDYGLRLAQKGDEKTLRRLGVTGEIKNKTLTSEQQIQIARKVVEKTQFKVDPQDLPGWTDSPGGKLVAQFRTFSYSQGKFFSNEILKPAMKGNLIPLSRLMAALPLGYALYETKRAIAGRPEEENKTKVGLQAFQNVGGAGLVFDLYQSLNPVGSKYLPPDRRTSMAIGAAGGPAVGVAAQGVGAISEAVQRKNTPTDESRLEGKLVASKNSNDYTDLTSLARFGLQQVPVVGTAVKNRLLPFTTESNADAGKTGNKNIDAINKSTTDQQKKFKASFSKNDYALYSLNKNEREQAVASNLVTQEKLDNLDKYAQSQKVKLGLAKPKTDLYSKPDAEYSAFKSEYDKKINDGSYSTAQKIKAGRELKKLEVGKVYDKNVRDLYSLNKTDLSTYLAAKEKGVDKQKIAKQLIAYDQALYDAGLEKYKKYKNGIAPSSKGRGRSKANSAKKDLTSMLNAIKSANAAVKPPTPPKSPGIKVQTAGLPSTYNKAALKQYRVSKPRASVKRKVA